MRDTTATVDAIFRIEYPKLVAGLTRRVGDVALAEELAQEAFLSALEQWPTQGVPDRPAAWLMSVAKRRGIDQWRRSARFAEREGEVGREIEARQEGLIAALEDRLDDQVGDDLLGLMFMSCHPVLSLE